jgi:outer membrane lipoprotein
MNTERGSISLVCIGMLPVLVGAGCAPVISPAVLKEVDQSVRFEQLLKNPIAYRGRTVLLGGDIIETQNFPEKTLIVVLERSLGFRKKPAAEGASKGRFIVSVPGFLDPAIYRPKRKVTVVGLVLGKEVRPLGEREYTYPIITKKELYIWPPEEYSATQPGVRFGVGIGIGL